MTEFCIAESFFQVWLRIASRETQIVPAESLATANYLTHEPLESQRENAEVDYLFECCRRVFALQVVANIHGPSRHPAVVSKLDRLHRWFHTWIQFMNHQGLAKSIRTPL